VSEVGLIAHVCNRGLACVVVRGNARASVRVWFDSELGEGTGVKERTVPPSESHWSLVREGQRDIAFCAPTRSSQHTHAACRLAQQMSA
jgi:hypothetical protein